MGHGPHPTCRISRFYLRQWSLLTPILCWKNSHRILIQLRVGENKETRLVVGNRLHTQSDGMNSISVATSGSASTLTVVCETCLLQRRSFSVGTLTNSLNATMSLPFFCPSIQSMFKASLVAHSTGTAPTRGYSIHFLSILRIQTCWERISMTIDISFSQCRKKPSENLLILPMAVTVFGGLCNVLGFFCIEIHSGGAVIHWKGADPWHLAEQLVLGLSPTLTMRKAYSDPSSCLQQGPCIQFPGLWPLLHVWSIV